MSYQTVFERYEMKYLVSSEQKQKIEQRMTEYMSPDKYGNSLIQNIYFDTPTFLLARRSAMKPLYKEKLRMRCYGDITEQNDVFIEIKKKYCSVVYKRRTHCPYGEVAYILSTEYEPHTQIEKEISYFVKNYSPLSPAVYLSYEREAFYGKSDSGFRVTFDKNILWRDYDLSLLKGSYGEPILGDGMYLMEIKTGTAVPLWMTAILSEEKLYKTSFSKYGCAYDAIYHNNIKGEMNYA
ncbi:MAG: polyphosphate polymerase domain-containing protein [Acutalibacteraceae bacterium]